MSDNTAEVGAATFRLNHEKAAAKIVEGEAIVINLTNGRYYSIFGAGGLAWDLISSGVTVATTVERVAARYDVDPARANTDVLGLVEALRSEDLLVSVDNEGHDVSSDAPDSEQARLEYTGMELVTYSDMEDLLALDPPLPSMARQPWTTRDIERGDEAST